MQQSMVRCSALAASKPIAAFRASAPRSVVLRSSRLVVRAENAKVEQPAAVESVEAATPVAVGAGAGAAVAAQPFSILGASQEAINGRAAMLGFMVAIVTELSTKQSVWSQIAGKYVNQELVETPIGFSTLFFGFVVVMTSLATFAPQVFENQGLTSRSFGPFTPSAELSNGRVAMLGFSALLLVELLRGNTALF